MKRNNVNTDKNRPKKGQVITDPGKGRRTPAKWGEWLIKGLQTQMLTIFGVRARSGNMWQGLHEPGSPRGIHERKVLAKRRAKTRAGRRQRVHQQMARRGK